MSDKELKDALSEALAPLTERLDSLDGRLAKALSQRNVALVTATFCLVAAIAALIFAVTAREALTEQNEANALVICSSARSTALAFRSPQVTEKPDGSIRKESVEHYIERLIAQRQVLLAAAGISCPSYKGFEAFTFLTGKALTEIDEILSRLAPHRFHNLPADGGEKDGSPTATAHRHGSNGAKLATAAAPSHQSAPSSAAAPGGAGPGKPTSAPTPSGGTGTGESPPHSHSEGSPPPKTHHEGGSGGKGKSPPSETSSPPVAETTSPPAASNPPAGSSPPATTSPVETPPPPTEMPHEEPAPPATTTGVIGNPGGIVGEVLCTVNKLGIRLCTE